MPKDLYYSVKGTPDEKVPRNVDRRTELYGYLCSFLSYSVRGFWETKENQTLCF